jgi:hypothetical protein
MTTTEDIDTVDQLDGSRYQLDGQPVDQVDDDPDSPAPPAPFDPLAELTLAELDAGSRLLKASIVSAITERNEHYERALPLVVWLWERRSNPKVKLAELQRLTWAQLHDHLAELAPEGADPEGPTAPGPAS